MDKLKPCPFCSEAILEDLGGYETRGRFFVRCSACDIAQDKLWATKRTAIERWNRRVVPDDFTVCGYDARSLIALSLVAQEAGVTEEDLKEFARNWESAYQFVREESLRIFEETIGKINRWEDKDER